MLRPETVQRQAFAGKPLDIIQGLAQNDGGDAMKKRCDTYRAVNRNRTDCIFQTGGQMNIVYGIHAVRYTHPFSLFTDISVEQWTAPIHGMVLEDQGGVAWRMFSKRRHY